MAKEWISEVLAQQLFGRRADLPRNPNWTALRRESRAQALDLPAFAFAQTHGAPEDVLKPWRTHAQQILLCNTAIFREHVILTQLLTDAGIPCCTLKGVASAVNYPDPLSRSMGDVDMLVSPADFEKAKTLLRQNGYTPVGNMKMRKNEHHVSFRKDELDIELHFVPCIPPDNDRRAATENALSTVLEERIACQTDFGQVFIPCPLHNGLILLIHLQYHLTGSGVGLRHLCDWATFISRTPDAPALLEKPLKELGLWRFARLATQAAERIGLPAQDWAQPREDVADELFAEIAYAGNFGRKDVRYATARRLIPADGQTRRGIPRRLGAYAVRAVKTVWPFFEKHPVFLPAGLLMYAVRSLFRLALGQTRLGNLKRNKENADRRAALFEKLDLWKQEDDA